MSPELEALRRAARQELVDAMSAHSQAYPNGDWKTANDRIGVARYKLDDAFGIDTAGLLGNEMILRITAPCLLAARPLFQASERTI